MAGKLFALLVCVFLPIVSGCVSLWPGVPREDDGMIRTVRDLPVGGGKAGAVRLREACPAGVLLGQPFEYTIEVTNLTRGELGGVTVTDRLAPGLELAASNPAAVPEEGNVVRYVLGRLGPGQTGCIRVRVVARKAGALGHRASVAYEESVGADIQVFPSARVPRVK